MRFSSYHIIENIKKSSSYLISQSSFVSLPNSRITWIPPSLQQWILLHESHCLMTNWEDPTQLHSKLNSLAQDESLMQAHILIFFPTTNMRRLRSTWWSSTGMTSVHLSSVGTSRFESNESLCMANNLNSPHIQNLYEAHLEMRASHSTTFQVLFLGRRWKSDVNTTIEVTYQSESSDEDHLNTF